jgi:hypothetical protein
MTTSYLEPSRRPPSSTAVVEVENATVHRRQPTSPAWERIAPGREKAAPPAPPGLCQAATRERSRRGLRGGRVCRPWNRPRGGDQEPEPFFFSFFVKGPVDVDINDRYFTVIM